MLSALRLAAALAAVASASGFAGLPPSGYARRTALSAKGFGAAGPTGGPKGKGSGLKADDGWVRLLNRSSELDAGPVATGKTLQGKEFLLRKMGGKVYCTDFECSRCQYPLLKSEVAPAEADGVLEITCEMCGAAAALSDGKARPSESQGNPVLGGLLRNKPQSTLRTYAVKDTSDGVYVNIEPAKFATQ